MREKTRPDTRAAIAVRIKGKPRGKSFEKNNGHGAEWRFKKGEPSANPSGRPKHKELSKALRARLESEGPLPKKGRLGAEILAERWFEEAKNGNVAALASLADRCEGRPSVSVTVEGEDRLEVLLLSMNQRSELIGPPDGMLALPEAKEEGSEDASHDEAAV